MKSALKTLFISITTLSIVACNAPSTSEVSESIIPPLSSEESSIDISSEQPSSDDISESLPSSEDVSSEEELSSEEISSEEIRSEEASSEEISSTEESSEDVSSEDVSSEELSSEEESSIEESSEEEEENETSATIYLTSMLDNITVYQYDFNLTKEMMEEDSFTFSKDIALFAYGTSIANTTKDKITNFYSDANFDHIVLNSIYETNPTTSSIGYAFAHKKFNNRDLISISVRGFNYSAEWADNLNVGLEGEHAGFAARADEINEALEKFVTENNYLKDNVTILLSGYSRGGAVANLLAKRLNDKKTVASKENIYTYTFEAPKGGIGEDEYNNIFNIVSGGDIITLFTPSEYGFKRYGVDIDLYNEDLDNLIKEFDPNISLPPYSEDMKGFAPNDAALASYVIDQALQFEHVSESDSRDIRTREKLVTNYGSTLAYMTSMFFSLKSSTTTLMKLKLLTLDTTEMFALLSEDGLYNFLKPFIDDDGYQYIDEELRTNCNITLEAVVGPFASLVALAISNSGASLSRMISQHYLEINYILLSNMVIPE